MASIPHTVFTGSRPDAEMMMVAVILLPHCLQWAYGFTPSKGLAVVYVRSSLVFVRMRRWRFTYTSWETSA